MSVNRWRTVRADAAAGLLVAFISLPLCIGVAIVSGAPPMAGLVGAIMAGLLIPFLGGTHITIGSPAAGLAPVLLMCGLNLGQAWSFVLVACFFASFLQVGLGWFKATRFGALFPTAAIEGMLAAIGLLIIAKELPHLLGCTYRAHEFFGYVGETPSALMRAPLPVLGLGIGCLGILFILGKVRDCWVPFLPVELSVVVMAVAAAQWLDIGAAWRLNIPANPFATLVSPDFGGLLSTSALWGALIVAVVKITLVSSIESLATVAAIDRKDPWRRTSDPHRALMAVGLVSACSGLLGGLPIIPESVRSSACIQAGGRTLGANFYNAVFLLIFLLCGRGLINLIPFTALAAVLMYTGWRLCRPSIWQHMAHIGWEQLVVFSVTVFAVLASDLLWGLGAGMAVKLLMVVWYSGRFTTLFCSPIVARQESGAEYSLFLDRPVVCFNRHHLEMELNSIPPETKRVRLKIGPRVTMIDHTSHDYLRRWRADRHGVDCDVQVEGLEGMRRVSNAVNCMYVS